MQFEALYQQAKWKRQHQLQLQQSKQQQIKQQSSMKKINPHSNAILVGKLQIQLEPFDDENLINIQTSIPVLYASSILQAITDIQDAKEKLQNGEFQNSRLRQEARFVYCLWKMIDQEEIETRQLKELIYMLNSKPANEIKKSLSDMYNDQESVSEFVETWKILLQNSNYYKSVERNSDKISDREIQKIIRFGPEGREKCLTQSLEETSQKSLITSLKDPFVNLDTLMTESMTGTKKLKQNKQNVFMDRLAQKSMIDRLYCNDRYQLRQAQKRVQEERILKAAMDECTFKPRTNSRLRSASRNKLSRSINGYEKSVQRMKVGIEKNRIQKQLRQYKPTGQNYEKIKAKKANPPKMLERKKTEPPIQFMIEFDLGRHKVKVKVHQTDTVESIAKNLCKIYCLKHEYFEQICLIIRKERKQFMKEQFH